MPELSSVLFLAQRSFPTRNGCLQHLSRATRAHTPRGACTCRSQCMPPAWEEAEGLRAAPPPPSWPSKAEVASPDCGCAIVGGCGTRRPLDAPAAVFPGLFAQSLGWHVGHRLPEGMGQKPESGTALPPPAEGEPRSWPLPNAI